MSQPKRDIGVGRGRGEPGRGGAREGGGRGGWLRGELARSYKDKAVISLTD